MGLPFDLSKKRENASNGETDPRLKIKTTSPENFVGIGENESKKDAEPARRNFQSGAFFSAKSAARKARSDVSEAVDDPSRPDKRRINRNAGK